MSLVKFRRDPAMSPWAEMAEMQNRIRHLFAEPFPSLHMFAEPVGWTPAVDVSESDGTLVVKAELPGMAKDDVEIDLVDNVLTLRGEKKLEEERTEGEMHVWERSYGSFQRAFTLSLPRAGGQGDGRGEERRADHHPAQGRRGPGPQDRGGRLTAGAGARPAPGRAPGGVRCSGTDRHGGGGTDVEPDDFP